MLDSDIPHVSIPIEPLSARDVLEIITRTQIKRDNRMTYVADLIFEKSGKATGISKDEFLEQFAQTTVTETHNTGEILAKITSCF